MESRSSPSLFAAAAMMAGASLGLASAVGGINRRVAKFDAAIRRSDKKQRRLKITKARRAANVLRMQRERRS